jgi:hypothetical protein
MLLNVGEKADFLLYSETSPFVIFIILMFCKEGAKTDHPWFLFRSLKSFQGRHKHPFLDFL